MQTPTQMLSCEVCKTFKDTYFEEYLQTTASGGVSSNINEVIRSVLNFLIFFYDKISQVQKSTKRIQGTKKYQKALKSIKTQQSKSTKRK